MGHEVVPDALGSFVRLPAGEPWTIGERAFDDGGGGKFAAATVDGGLAMLSRIRAAMRSRLRQVERCRFRPFPCRSSR